MENTENLALPYIMPSQLQPHVTHNEALRALDAIAHLAVADKDLSAPPGSPAAGARYIVGGSPTGAWSGHAAEVAAWQDGAWAFYAPVTGWIAWVHDESRFYLFSAGAWTEAPGSTGSGVVPKGAWSAEASYARGDLVEHGGHAFLSNADDNTGDEPDSATPASSGTWTYFAILTGGGGGGGGADINPAALVGVNAVADASNRLAVSSPATLFSHEGGDHRLKVNKAAAGDTASVLFQTGFVGHAEFGLAGDDDWHVKVSADGSTWREAIIVDAATGAVSLPNTAGGGGGRELLSAARTYHVDASSGSDGNDGLSGGTAFATIQKAVDVAAGLDLGINDVTIAVADGTYTSPVTLRTLSGAGKVVIAGNTSSPANVLISLSAIGGTSAAFQGRFSGTYRLTGMKIQVATSGAATFLQGFGAVVEIEAMDFGACPHGHLRALDGAMVDITGAYTISGGTSRHWQAGNSGVIRSTNTFAITLSGTPAWSSEFAYAGNLAGINTPNKTFSGSATGKRYTVAENAVIRSGGGSGSYFPGNADGSSSSGGQYV